MQYIISEKHYCTVTFYDACAGWLYKKKKTNITWSDFSRCRCLRALVDKDQTEDVKVGERLIPESVAAKVIEPKLKVIPVSLKERRAALTPGGGGWCQQRSSKRRGDKLKERVKGIQEKKHDKITSL